MLRRESVPKDLLVQDRPPDPAEVPKGFRLRRIGPGQWVAEPFSVRWRIWGTVIASCIMVSGATVQAMRVYHLRKAQAEIVRVNGVPIRRDHVMARLEQKYGEALVGSMVADELMRQFAVSRGCWPSEAEVRARFKEEAAQPGFEEGLIKTNSTEAEYKERLRHRLAEIHLIVQGVQVSEAEVRYFYQRNVDPANPRAVFRSPERIQVAAIATASREAAQRALEALMRDEPWPSVVARFSIDPSREHAGLLDPLIRGRSLFSADPDAEAALFRLHDGERSDVLKAAGKWWIARCLRKWPASVIPYDRAHKDAEMGARIEIGAARNGQKVAVARREFVRRASILVLDRAYDAVSRPVLSDRSP